jgi:hypothetical protein
MEDDLDTEPFDPTWWTTLRLLMIYSDHMPRKRAECRAPLRIASPKLSPSLRGTGSSNPSPSSRQSVSLPLPLSNVENPAFRAGLGSWLDDGIGRDAPGFPLRANRRQCLCRAIFQYRSTAGAVSAMPRWSERSQDFSGLSMGRSLNSS